MKLSPAQTRLPSDAGISLIELLVVLAIISLAYTIAMPNLFTATPSTGLRATALDMKSRLAAARAAAIARSRPVALIVDLPRRRYASEADGRWIALPDNLSLSVTTARDIGGRTEVPRLVFFPDGSSSGGKIQLRKDHQSYNVSVNWLTGEASMEAAP
jgi:general secretion pathway protein H